MEVLTLLNFIYALFSGKSRDDFVRFEKKNVFLYRDRSGYEEREIQLTVKL